jgi:GT2 family glycosyltransferase
MNSKPAVGVVHIVSATRYSEDDFWLKSALGKSLKLYRSREDIAIHVHYSNSEGLSSIYNRYIKSSHGSDILVFVHDDVWLEQLQDSDWLDSVRIGVSQYDVIGVAGNVRFGPTQPGWCFRAIENSEFIWDKAYLSGSVGHGSKSTTNKDYYGPVPMDCKVLDGLFLAMRSANLRRSKVQFDPRFKFHFYDLDFCREANRRGLTLGTWLVPLTHQSRGALGTTSWVEMYTQYLEKWNP